MAAAMLGGLGLGLVWGSVLAMLAWPARGQTGRTLAGLGLASLLLTLGIYALFGLPAATALMIAAVVALSVGIGWRVERHRHVGADG
jgi:hypothetical protein